MESVCVRCVCVNLVSTSLAPFQFFFFSNSLQTLQRWWWALEKEFIWIFNKKQSRNSVGNRAHKLLFVDNISFSLLCVSLLLLFLFFFCFLNYRWCFCFSSFSNLIFNRDFRLAMATWYLRARIVYTHIYRHDIIDELIASVVF